MGRMPYLYVTHQRAHNGVMIARELTERDVHGALSVVAEAAAPDADGPFGLPVLEQLTELISVDHALAYIEYDLDTQAWGPSSVEYPVVVYPAVLLRLPSCSPSTRCAKSPSASSEIPLTLSDFLTPRARRRNPFVQEVLRPAGIEHELKVFLPAPPGTICEFDFTRGPGRDFDERDRAILLLLRPHLARLRHRWAAKHPAGLPHRSRTRNHPTRRQRSHKPRDRRHNSSSRPTRFGATSTTSTRNSASTPAPQQSPQQPPTNEPRFKQRRSGLCQAPTASLSRSPRLGNPMLRECAGWRDQLLFRRSLLTD